MTPEEKHIYDLVRAELKDELVPEEYRGIINNRFCGHCHHATISMYYLLGGKEKGYKVKKAIDELKIKHYWLETFSGEVIDPTVEQYIDLNRATPYENKATNRVSYRKTKAALTIISNVQKEISKGQ